MKIRMKDFFLNKSNWIYFLLFIISLFVFHVIYGIQTIIPTNISWMLSVYHDWGQHYLGWAFYRQDEWHFPLGEMYNFFYPVGTNVGFTDSIPLMAFICKIFSFLLPDNFQYFGFWLFLCLFLNAYYTTKILKLFNANNYIIVLASILLITNPVLTFRGMHPSLCAHWLFLGSFYHYFIHTTKDSVKSNFKKQGILFFLSATINPYFGIMIAAFVITLAIKNYFYDKSFTKKEAFIYPLISIGSGLLFWIAFGMIELKNGTSLDVGNIYGTIYSFNLNSFFNSYGFYSKYIPQIGMTNDSQHEGFGYLGLGLIVLVVISFFTIIYYIAKRKINKSHNYLSLLIILCAVMLLFAITNTVTFGKEILFHYPTLGIVEKIGNIFRATGRFSWPFYYLMIIIALIIFNQLKINTTLKLVLLTIVTIFQLYDIENLLTSRDLKHGQYHSKLDEEKWKLILDNFDEIITFPAFSNNMVYKMDYQDLMYVALKSKKPITIGYVARENVKKSQEYKDTLISRLSTGKITSKQIFVTNHENIANFKVLLYQDKVNVKRLDKFVLIYSKAKTIKTDYLESKEDKNYSDSIKNFYKNSLKLRLVNSSWKSEENIMFNIEQFNSKDNIINIKGWAFNKNVNNNSKDSIFICLSDNQKSYIFPTTIVARQDITAANKKENLDNSGFSTTLFTDKLPIKILKLGIVIKDRNGSFHYGKTDKIAEQKKPDYKEFTIIKKLPLENLPIIYNLEKVEKTISSINISGWAALDKMDSKNNSVKLIVTSRNVIYRFTTNLVMRNDVSNANKNKFNYDFSGFELKISTKQLPKGNYTIGIEIENSTTHKTHYKQVTNTFTL